MKAFRRILVTASAGAILIGLLFIFIGLGLGGSWSEGAYYGFGGKEKAVTEINEVYTGIENIKLRMDYGELRIEKGDRFSVTGSNILEEQFSSSVENGNWNITYRRKGIGVWFLKRYPENDSVLTVTIPENSAVGSFELEMGAGKCAIDAVNGQDINIHLGAGTIRADRLKAEKSLKLDIGAGEFWVEEAGAGEADLNCSAGKLTFYGEITKRGSAKCSVGEIDLRLSGGTKEYGFTGSCSVGKIEIDGSNYSGSSSVRRNTDAPRQIRLNCSVGKIYVETLENE